MYHCFSYQALEKVTKMEVLCHDAVIEGGTGNNVARYLYFRDHGYTGLYIGVDPDQKSTVTPTGLVRERADCFDIERLLALCSRYQLSDPVFVTNSPLYLLVGGNKNRIAKAVEALTTVFRKQLHVRPTDNYSLTASRLRQPNIITSGELSRIRRFLEESGEKGWSESVPGKNTLLLKRNEGAYNIIKRGAPT